MNIRRENRTNPAAAALAAQSSKGAHLGAPSPQKARSAFLNDDIVLEMLHQELLSPMDFVVIGQVNKQMASLVFPIVRARRQAAQEAICDLLVGPNASVIAIDVPQRNLQRHGPWLDRLDFPSLSDRLPRSNGSRRFLYEEGWSEELYSCLNFIFRQCPNIVGLFLSNEFPDNLYPDMAKGVKFQKLTTLHLGTNSAGSSFVRSVKAQASHSLKEILASEPSTSEPNLLAQGQNCRNLAQILSDNGDLRRIEVGLAVSVSALQLFLDQGHPRLETISFPYMYVTSNQIQTFGARMWLDIYKELQDDGIPPKLFARAILAGKFPSLKTLRLKGVEYPFSQPTAPHKKVAGFVYDWTSRLFL